MPPPHLMWEAFDIIFTGVRHSAAAPTAAERDARAEEVVADLRACRSDQST
jgi:hypothetical protein